MEETEKAIPIWVHYAYIRALGNTMEAARLLIAAGGWNSASDLLGEAVKDIEELTTTRIVMGVERDSDN